MPITTGRITVGTTATQIVPANSRSKITVTTTQAIPVYCGPAGVTVSNGQLIPGVVGASETFDTSAAIFGVVDTGTVVVTFAEIT